MNNTAKFYKLVRDKKPNEAAFADNYAFTQNKLYLTLEEAQVAAKKGAQDSPGIAYYVLESIEGYETKSPEVERTRF